MSRPVHLGSAHFTCVQQILLKEIVLLRWWIEKIFVFFSFPTHFRNQSILFCQYDRNIETAYGWMKDILWP